MIAIHSNVQSSWRLETQRATRAEQSTRAFIRPVDAVRDLDMWWVRRLV
jgi:hypothetical protein